MADIATIAAQPRDRVGKGAARATRRTGLIPGVIYGDRKDPVTIAIDPKDLDRELHKAGFFISQFDVAVDGARHRVMARDVQLHPISDAPIHVDFLRVTGKTRITVDIPVIFTGEEESPGLSRGGVLNVVRHTIEVNATVDSIPEAFVFDLSVLDIGDSVHISNIDLPEGVEPTITDRDFTVATIAAPTVVRDEAAEAAEALLGEEGEELEEGAEAAEEEEGSDQEGSSSE